MNFIEIIQIVTPILILAGWAALSVYTFFRLQKHMRITDQNFRVVDQALGKIFASGKGDAASSQTN